jgi:L-malate glycosyltransferase
MRGYPWGGSEELWAETALEALGVGHEVFVSVLRWTKRAPKLRELELRGARILERNNPDLPLQGSSFASGSSYRDLFNTNPDVILLSQGWIFDVLLQPDLLELLYVTPIPFVIVCQLNDGLPVLADEYRRKHAGNIFARAFRVLFVSNQNRIDAERQLATKLTNSNITLNPVNLSDRSYLPWPDSDTVRFASVARLETKFKGQDILFETLSTDQWKRRDWHLTLYGSGPDERYLHALVDFFGLQERVTFAGHQSDVRAIWAQEQVLVMFSRSEGTPLALVEAMLCGRPAIVSDVGGNQEWVTESETGYVAEAPVIGLARDALERAWSARQSWKAMGLEAHKVASARIGDSSLPSLLEILLETCRYKRPSEGTSGEELERLKHYRELMQPPIGERVKRVAKAGALRLRRALDRWRAVRVESRDRALLRLAELRKTR